MGQSSKKNPKKPMATTNEITRFVSPNQIDWDQFGRLSLEEWASIPSWFRREAITNDNACWLKKNVYAVLGYPGAYDPKTDTVHVCIRYNERSAFKWEVVNWCELEVQDILGAVLVMQKMRSV